MQNTMSNKSLHQTQKNLNVPLDSSLFINCTFDTEYLEVTKTESLRKYEENIYLLGTIYSNNKNIIENNEYDKENEESIDEDILNLFKENHLNKNFENDVEKINNIIKSTTFESDKEKALLNQLNISIKDYKETYNFLKSAKDNIIAELKDYSELNQKLRISKNIEGEIDELINKADQFGILPNTFKQQENFLRKKREKSNSNQTDSSEVDVSLKINKELPWGPDDNFIVMNL